MINYKKVLKTASALMTFALLIAAFTNNLMAVLAVGFILISTDLELLCLILENPESESKKGDC